MFDGIEYGCGVEGIGLYGAGSGFLETVCGIGRSGEADDSFTGGNELGNERTADGACGAGQENFHGPKEVLGLILAEGDDLSCNRFRQSVWFSQQVGLHALTLRTDAKFP